MSRVLVFTLLLIGGLALPALSFNRELLDGFERPDEIIFPPNAPYSPQRAALGKMLFFEPRLSGAQNMSCATCHNPSFGWETPVALAIGALNQPLDRHAPTVENLAEAEEYFWDGRAASLEEQAVGPITHPLEMNAQMDEVVARLAQIATYRDLFEIAYPQEGLTPETVVGALATYERTLQSGRAPFDDWVEGDETAISEAAKRGFDLFVGEAQCASCHNGWAFTDHGFHAVGTESDDIGRGAIEPGSEHMFKTPGLRNITLRAPYMHNGSIPTLRQVMEHYQMVGDPNAEIESDVGPFELTGEAVDDILAFLETLTAYDPHVRAPALPAE